MRSHFLTPQEIGRLFTSHLAEIKYEDDGATAWIIIEKRTA
jgi:hypothetical protein